MGGRGDYLVSGGFVEYHYETIDKIDGVKVLHYKDGNQKVFIITKIKGQKTEGD